METTDNVFGTPDKHEITHNGDLGKEYQRKVCGLQLLVAHKELHNYKVSCEAKEAGLFDDVVLEYLEEENGEKKICFVQIKHKANIKNKFDGKVLVGDKKSAAYLPKYFLSFLDINADKMFKNFKHKTFSLFTNGELEYKYERDDTNKMYLSYHNNGIIKIYVEEVPSNDKLVTHRKGKCFKIKTDETNDEFIKYFKKCVIEEMKKKTDENEHQDVEENDIKNFFDNFILSVCQQPIEKIDEELEEFFSENFNDMRIKNDFLSLFDNAGKKITKDDFEKFLAGVTTDKCYKGLIGITNEFLGQVKSANFESAFFESFKKLQKVSILKTPRGLGSLGVKAIAQNFHENHIKNGRIILKKSSSLKNLKFFKECLTSKIPDLLFIEAENENSFALKDLVDGIDTKIVFICDFDCKNAEIPVKVLSNDGNLFGKLTKSSQEQLMEFKVDFQGELLSFKEIFEKPLDEIFPLVDDEILARILGKTFLMGDEIESLNFSNDFYIERTYKSNHGDICHGIHEFSQLNLTEKAILFWDAAGMGKSTELIKIGQKIKEENKSFWVLKIDLGSQKFFDIFFEWDKNDWLSLLKKFIDTPFEQKVFQSCYEKGKVVILLDGFDEIPSEIHLNVLMSFLTEVSIKNEHKNKFIGTSRTNLIDDLLNSKKTHRISSPKVYKLLPFTSDEQKTFFHKYMTKELTFGLSDDGIKKFCDDLVSKFASKFDNFLGNPLLLQMLAEVFANIASDHFKLHKKFPEISDGVYLTDLFRLFIDRKYFALQSKAIGKEIFIKLCRGEVKVEETLLNFATLILNKKPFKYSQDDCNVMMQTGLMNFIREEPSFIHRAFPEFLVSKKFFEVLCNEEIENFDEIVEANRSIFEIVLRDNNPMVWRFVNEFLKEREKSKFDVEILQSFFKRTKVDALALLPRVILEVDAYNLFLLIFESILNAKSLSSKQSLKIFNQNLSLVAKILSKIFNKPIDKDSRKVLDFLNTWRGIENDKHAIGKELMNFLLQELSSNSRDIEEQYEMNFLNFLKEFDSKLIKVLLDKKNSVCYGIYVNLLNIREVKDFLENWTKDYTGLNYNEELKNQLKEHKQEVLQFLIKNFLEIDINTESYPNSEKLLKLVEKKVDPINFAFPLIDVNDNYDVTIAKLRKMKKTFENSPFKEKYEEILKKWRKATKKACEQLGDQYENNSEMLSFIAKSLIGFTETDQIKFESLDQTECKVFQKFIKHDKTGFLTLQEEIKKKLIDKLIKNM